MMKILFQGELKRMLNETIYTKRAAIKRLRVTRSRYEQLLESEILAKPITLVPGAHPIHTESQIVAAENNLTRRAMDEYRQMERTRAQKGYKPIKPIKALKPNQQFKKR